ncbi:ATP-binding cassette domain-containing protein [Paenibacillus aceris]|uniref:Energy-coupling factor transport system ATP-binding protein n=1 Tax=Paenibacillus aceris TaxID=869555 RepID=A0ABS4I8E0_9BACL|nr:ATP-binding cassette domain-containing protein [Paenibacillus aceris]MBP1966354.1 energy-coupling factor transport system ATP-binding protein [Paenibacillus aceris]NHW38612.1 ATP-binding cassette domain-containing protein [Paenibacillus aceris]
MSIALQNIQVNAPDDPHHFLLKDISFELSDGSVTILIGHTGSGKSTLLQVMAGIMEPSTGAISLDGQPLWHTRKVNQAHLLRLGLIFQFPEQQLFAGSIRGEFAYSLRPYRLAADERERRIRAACADLDPHGAFALERSPFALSGGEQRRLALATTFATAPDWLLMDEPTAGLEAAAVRELLRLIRGRERGGFVIATHDLDTFLPLADRVLVLDRGELVFDGSPEALCRAPELLTRAGVGLPSCVEAAQVLARCGIAIAPDLLTPELAAPAILNALRERGSASPEPAPQAAAPKHAREARVTPAPPQAAWLALDPRAKWLLYLLLVIGTMQQQLWSGLAASALLLGLSFLGLPRSVIRGSWKVAVPFLIFMLLSIMLAGLEWRSTEGQFPLGFSIKSGWSAAFTLTRLFLILMAGYWLAVSTTYGQLVQGLNWALAFFRRMKLPVESFALAVSLLFRFIPLILREWQRFSAIVRARGKAAIRPGMVRMRDIPALVVPLLLAMFHKAEQMTVAMEMKKVDGKHQLLKKSTLSWRTKDTLLVILSGVAFGVLMYMRD